jgi:hypothetical protein
MEWFVDRGSCVCLDACRDGGRRLRDALVAPKIGLAWPYPLVLPDQTHFHGAWYDRSDHCLV